MNFRSSTFTALFTAIICSGSLQAEITLDTAAEQVKKIEVFQSMMGYRDTLRFYVFHDSKSVLVAKIGNKTTEFPATAKLYQFADDTTPDALGKWVNNQHSDGLFAGAPKPTATHEVPASSCSVKSHQLTGQAEGVASKFNRYNVTFEIKDVALTEDISIKGFTDTVDVFVKTEKK